MKLLITLVFTFMVFVAPTEAANYSGEAYEARASDYYDCMAEWDDEDYCDEETKGATIPLPVLAFLAGLGYYVIQREHFKLWPKRESAYEDVKDPYTGATSRDPLPHRPNDIHRYALLAGFAIGFGVEEVFYGTLRLVGFY